MTDTKTAPCAWLPSSEWQRMHELVTWLDAMPDWIEAGNGLYENLWEHRQEALSSLTYDPGCTVPVGAARDDIDVTEDLYVTDGQLMVEASWQDPDDPTQEITALYLVRPRAEGTNG